MPEEVRRAQKEILEQGNAEQGPQEVPEDKNPETPVENKQPAEDSESEN